VTPSLHRDELTQQKEEHMHHLMSTKDLAEMLGCSERHISRLRDRGLKAIRLGSVVRFRPEDIQEFLDTHTLSA
jgi:excisionase family DNA binding protein